METSGSEGPVRARAFPRIRALMDQLSARRAWEAENPELAAAWTEALAEDDTRGKALDLARRQAAMAAGAPATLNKLGVPRPVSHALSAPRATPALLAAKEWWLSGRPVLLLLGGVGSGKTTGAAWVLLRQLEREAGVTHPSGGHPVDPAMFATAPEFNGLSDYHPESRAWLERLCRCTLLVLDDLGTERMGDGELSCVQRVISERHATNRRTVLTSNLTAAAFVARYGERVADRIRESGTVRASAEPGQQSLRLL
jgi:hypothetical protein